MMRQQRAEEQGAVTKFAHPNGNGAAMHMLGACAELFVAVNTGLEWNGEKFMGDHRADRKYGDVEGRISVRLWRIQPPFLRVMDGDPKDHIGAAVGGRDAEEFHLIGWMPHPEAMSTPYRQEGRPDWIRPERKWTPCFLVPRRDLIQGFDSLEEYARWRIANGC